MKHSVTFIRLGLAMLTAALVLGGVMLGAAAPQAHAAGEAPAEQQGPTATPSPAGQINLPTSTATAIGGPTATPSRTPTVTPVIVETIGDPTTNLRAWPAVGDAVSIVAELPPGTRLPVIGRWIGYDWYLVQWEDAPDGQAWVYKPLVMIVVGDETTIPAVTPPPLPTIDPTQQAIQATATVLIQTPGAAETATAAAVYVPTGIYTQTPNVPGAAAGALPTFTAPPPLNPREMISTPGAENRGGVPPAVIIISLGAMGLLTLAVGLIRRL